jgi:ssDNA-binding Zn-finger/Zn-ribbon topoisomerase 1
MPHKWDYSKSTWQNVAERHAAEAAAAIPEANRANCGGCGRPTDATEPYCGHCGFPEGSEMVRRGWEFAPEDPRFTDPRYADPAYQAYCEEQEREHELEQQHGGKTRCPKCDQFTVEHRVVEAHRDPTDYARCTNPRCDYASL